jgi:arylsulfatase A-like enzyme
MQWYDWRLPTQPAAVTQSFARRAGGQADNYVYQEFLKKMGRLALPEEMCFDRIVADLSAEEIRGAGGPFAVTCSFGAPHDPWAAPEPYYSMHDPARMELPPDFDDPNPALADWSSRLWAQGMGEAGVREYLRVYHAQLSSIDAQVGRLVRLLEESGLLEDTLIIFTADHGDMLGHHNMVEKGIRLPMAPVLHVPLIVACPGKIAGATVVDEPVSHVDVMPTILDYVGLEAPAGIDGRSLPGLMEGNRAGWRPYGFSQTSGLSRAGDRYSRVIRRQSVIETDRWKCIYEDTRPVALFDRQSDPNELDNIVGRAPAGVLAELRGHFEEAWSQY